jgi:two-component system, OmpR family, response regulator
MISVKPLVQNTKPYVLIVDDEEDLIFFLELYFNRKNIEIFTAGTLSKAKEYITQSPPSLLIIDDHLPDGSGWEFGKVFAALYPETYVIFISAHHNASKLFPELNQEMHMIIAKPFTLELFEKQLQTFTNPDLRNLVGL